MTTLDHPPLIEAILELRWGEVAPGRFSFSQDEKLLLAGKVSASATSKGYATAERAQEDLPGGLPLVVSHRFREQTDSWPCYQIGFGIFTVNQIAEGYKWSLFKDHIKTGLEILNQADQNHLKTVSNTLSLVLRYQDAFFPEKGDSVEKYLAKHFNVKAGLPEMFLDDEDIDRSKSSINLKVNIDTKKPKGSIVVSIANAIINNRPGLLMETVVVSKVQEGTEGRVDVDSIVEWCDMAHNLQRHSFKTLINSTAYK